MAEGVVNTPVPGYIAKAPNAEASDNVTFGLQAGTTEVSTDANGRARLTLPNKYTQFLHAFVVTRAASKNTIGTVTVDLNGADLGSVYLLFRNSAGKPEANTKRKVSWMALGY